MDTPTKHQKFKKNDLVEIVWANDPKYKGMRFIVQDEPEWRTLYYKAFGEIRTWYYKNDECLVLNTSGDKVPCDIMVAERFLKLVDGTPEELSKLTSKLVNV